MAVKMSVLRIGTRTDVNSLAGAAELGAKLERYGQILQDPSKIEIVARRYWLKEDPDISVFHAATMGDNGKWFHAMVIFEKATKDDDFVSAAPPGGDDVIPV